MGGARGGGGGGLHRESCASGELCFGRAVLRESVPPPPPPPPLPPAPTRHSMIARAAENLRCSHRGRDSERGGPRCEALVGAIVAIFDSPRVGTYPRQDCNIEMEYEYPTYTVSRYEYPYLLK